MDRTGSTEREGTNRGQPTADVVLVRAVFAFKYIIIVFNVLHFSFWLRNGVIDGPLDEIVVVISQVEGPNPSTLVLDLDFIVFSGGGPASLTMTAVLEEEGQPQA